MRHHFRYPIRWIPLLLLMASCSGQEPEPPPEAETEDPVEPPALYENFVDEMYELPDCMVDGEPCVKMHFQYPDFRTGEPLGDSLAKWTHKRMFDPETDPPATEASGLVDEWFEDYRQYQEQIEEYRIPWALERRIEVIYESDRLVTLHFSEFSFTGGTHPVQIDHFRSFSRPDGKILRLEDLTMDNCCYDRLQDLAEEQYRFTYELLEGDNAEDAGYHFLEDRFHLTDNFAFTEFGLLFYFNSYEVAPYATGPIAIEIPYEDLEHLIRPSWLTGTDQRTL